MKQNAVGAGVLVAILLLFAAATGGAVADVQDEEESEANGTFGAEVSSFMQASTAEAETEVEEGVFRAGMRRADTPEEQRQLIERRQARLAARQVQLQEQRDELADDQSAAKNRAVATRVKVGAKGLERSVESTQEHAARVGINTDQLNDLREHARSLSENVSEYARELAGSAGAGNDRSSNGNDDPPGADKRNGDKGNGTDQEGGVASGEFGDADDSDDSSE